MILNIIDLNKIKAFRAVAQSGTLIAASKNFGLTTSAIYQSIKKLEQDISVVLFYRSGKKYILTPAGEKLFEISKTFEIELNQYLQEHTKQDRELNGHIRLALPLNFSKTVFAPFMNEFCEKYPNIKFSLSIGESHQIQSKIDQFEIDFAIADQSTEIINDKKILAEKIYSEELVLVCSKAFYQKNKSKMNRADELMKLRHLVYSEEFELIKKWYWLGFQKKAKLKNIHVVDNVETLLSLILIDFGLGIVPRSLFLSLHDSKKLIAIEGEDENKKGPENGLYLIQNLDYIPGQSAKVFMEEFKRYIQEPL